MEKEHKLKIAVLHDHLGFVGGGERTVMLLALRLGADFITAYADPKTFADYQERLGTRLKILSKRIINTKGVRFFWIRGLFLFNRKLFYGYDIVIVSGHSATDVVAGMAKKDAVKILYVHNPPRRVYDLYEVSKKSYPLFLQPLYVLFVKYWKWQYLRAFRKYDFTIANSEHIKNQVNRYTGNTVNAVVWPPIMTDNFKWIKDGDYFLSWARVDEMKRIDLLVKAFIKMPEEKLVIASSGPKIDEIRELAKGYYNIKVVGFVPDKELFELVGKCRAAVYIPVNEDAGMTHIEANAAGKPVLAVREGGLIESVVDGETGVLIKADPTEEDIADAVSRMKPDWCRARRQACEAHAKKFDQEEFYSKMEKIVSANDPRRPLLGIDASRWEDPRFPGEGRRTGVETAAFHIIKELVPLALSRGLRVRLYTPRPIGDFPFTIQKVLPGCPRWTGKRLAPELKNSPPDYFFTPAYFIPRTAPEQSFAVIHDVLFKTAPERYALKERLWQEITTRWNLRRSKKIITVSEFSKKDIMRNYRVESGRIAVAALGYERRQEPGFSGPKDKSVLFIGRVEKKKSVGILVDAFAIFAKEHPDWTLVLAGSPGHGHDEIRKKIERAGLTGRVELPGYVTEGRKWEYLKRAAVFVHPSAHEGSCLPLYEAWDAGVPAVVSDAEVMREVAGGAASYFKAGDAGDLAEKLSAAAEDASLRSRLTVKGGGRLEGLSWPRTASAILDCMLES